MNFDNNNPLMGQSLQDMLYSMKQKNLVYNYDFSHYSNIRNVDQNDYGIPDGWVYVDTGTGGQITAIDDCCKIITGKGNATKMTLQQSLHEFPRWEEKLKGQYITAKAIMNLSDSCQICLTLTDGISKSSILETAIGDTELQVKLKVSTEAVFLMLILESTTPNVTIKIKKVFANIGSIALENLPCIVNGSIGELKQYVSTDTPPPEEISLCNLEHLQLNSNYTRLDSIINKKFGATIDGKYSVLPDFRGLFCRSWNNGSNIDPDVASRKTPGNDGRSGDLVGTVQPDIFKEHNHTLSYSTAGTFKMESPVSLIGSGQSNSGNTGGKETRPKNISVLYTIKWA